MKKLSTSGAIARTRISAFAQTAISALRCLIPAILMVSAIPSSAGCVSSRCARPTAVINTPAAGATFIANSNITMAGRAYGDVVYTYDGEPIIFDVHHVDVYKDGVVVGTATLGAN